MSIADFDRFCEEHQIPMEVTHIAFKIWLERLTGHEVVMRRLVELKGEEPDGIR
jgi:hypothetical protein